MSVRVQHMVDYLLEQHLPRHTPLEDLNPSKQHLSFLVVSLRTTCFHGNVARAPVKDCPHPISSAVVETLLNTDITAPKARQNITERER